MILTEFQSIMPMVNIPSILNLGILSNVGVAGIVHQSVALEGVQEIRDDKSVPGGFGLHDYANVYFHARNPMMSLKRSEAPDLCVLRVSLDILELNGAVVSDQNAVSKYVKFSPPREIENMDLDYIFARDWKHPDDQIAEWRHSSAKGAEALIPNKIPPKFITGAYVWDMRAEEKLAQFGFTLPIAIDADLFFR